MRGNWPLLPPIVFFCLQLSPAACFSSFYFLKKRSCRGPDGVVRGLDSILPRSNLCAGTGLCCLPLYPVVSRCLPLLAFLLYFPPKARRHGVLTVLLEDSIPYYHAQICARELASVVSYCLPLSLVVSRCLPLLAVCFICSKRVAAGVLTVLLKDSTPYYSA